MNLSRRELLALIALASTAPITGCASRFKKPKTGLILSGAYDAATKHEPRLALAVHRFDGALTQLIPTAVAAHSIVQAPHASSQFVLFPQASRTAALIALAEDKGPVHEFTATPGWMFYGHGAYTFDGTGIYAVETQEFRGKIVLRDLKTFNVQKEWPLPGFGAHDCQLSDDGRLLYVAMDGLYATAKNQFAVAESSLLELNLQTGGIRRRAASPQGLALGHFALSATSAVAGAMKIKGDQNSSLALASPSGDFRELTLREKTGKEEEALSVAIHDGAQVVGGVCPKSNRARFWNSQTGAFRGELQLTHPVGISAVKEGFVITSRDGVTRVDASTLDHATASVNLEGLSYLAHNLAVFI